LVLLAEVETGDHDDAHIAFGERLREPGGGPAAESATQRRDTALFDTLRCRQPIGSGSRPRVPSGVSLERKT
jgi:hypothetical protein